MANLAFNKDEMQSIYEKMREINILGTKEFSQQGGCFKTPSNIDSWKITIDGETKTFSWTDQNCSVTNDANQLLEYSSPLKGCRMAALRYAYWQLSRTE